MGPIIDTLSFEAGITYTALSFPAILTVLYPGNAVEAVDVAGTVFDCEYLVSHGTDQRVRVLPDASQPLYNCILLLRFQLLGG